LAPTRNCQALFGSQKGEARKNGVEVSVFCLGSELAMYLRQR
jgi:hypothetical protein